MYQLNDIYELLQKHLIDEKIGSDSDIFDDFGCAGDDFHELMADYASSFTVDMSGYLWYFYGDEEGNGFFAFHFAAPPYKRVKRIPVTPLMLLEFANSGKWNIDYPEHKLPKRRYDIIFNQIMVVCLILYLIYLYIF